jgi:glycosyltransferase involved in cell wall biosynthesis
MQKIQPLVSVCIPVYNGAAFIAESVASVLAQTYRNIELIVSDNASSDETLRILERFDDPRLRIIRQATNIGGIGNWNHCLNIGQGTYRKLLCHDDRLHPECIAKQVSVFEQPGNESISLVTTSRRIINPEGKAIFTRRWKLMNQQIVGSDAIRQVVRSGSNRIGEPGAVLFRASDWNALDGFSARCSFTEDLEFWVKLLRRGNCFYLAKPLFDFRVSVNSFSVRMEKEHCRHFVRFIYEARQAEGADVSKFDCLLGVGTAKVTALGRRLIYHSVFWRERGAKTNQGMLRTTE